MLVSQRLVMKWLSKDTSKANGALDACE